MTGETSPGQRVALTRLREVDATSTGPARVLQRIDEADHFAVNMALGGVGEAHVVPVVAMERDDQSGVLDLSWDCCKLRFGQAPLPGVAGNDGIGLVPVQGSVRVRQTEESCRDPGRRHQRTPSPSR